MYVMLLLAWAPYLVGGGIALWLGARYVRAVERRNVGGAELAEIKERLLRLEESLGQVSDDVQRVAEGQQFTTRVLADRARPAEPREPSAD